MAKCNVNKVALHGCAPVNLLQIFRTPFLKNSFGWLFLKVIIPFTYFIFLCWNMWCKMTRQQLFFCSCDLNVLAVIKPYKKQERIRNQKRGAANVRNYKFWQNTSISIFKFSQFLYTMKACQWISYHFFKICKPFDKESEKTLM